MGEDHWHWQEGRIWKGIGIYHVTIVVPSREPVLGKLVIPEDNPANAQVERTELGEAILKIMFKIPDFHPEVRILQFCLMPDHLHFILYVTRTMPKGIGTVVRGFWQGAKKIGREFASIVASPDIASPNPASPNFALSDPASQNHASFNHASSVFPNSIRKNEQSQDKGREQNIKKEDNEKSLDQADAQAEYSIFTEKPFIRPLSRRGQLHAMVRYVQMNPQRLATKRLMPGFFRVQHEVEIGGRQYDAVGNIGVLQADRYAPVHVRRVWVEDAERHGYDKPLRDYMNGCIITARQGTVMVSPFISPKEKAVLDVLLQENHPVIYIADNGFGEYYKPSDGLFEAVAAGKMLILSPWQHDPDKRHVTRQECVEMNKMAEEIAATETSY